MIHSRVTVSSRRKGILLLFTAHAGLWTIPLRLALRIQWRRPTNRESESENERTGFHFGTTTLNISPSVSSASLHLRSPNLVKMQRATRATG